MSNLERAATNTAGGAIGTARREMAATRVQVRPGSGKITINNRPFDEFFLAEADRQAVEAPLNDTDTREKVDVIVRVDSAGAAGQLVACRVGIAQALIKYDQSLYEVLRDNGHLACDAQMVERKKYGLHGARRRTQFPKR